MAEVSYATEGLSDSPPAPFTASIISAHEELARITERLGELADRLVGTAPSTDSNQRVSGPVAVPNGVLTDMEERGHDMCAKLDRMRGYLARIERALP